MKSSRRGAPGDYIKGSLSPGLARGLLATTVAGAFLLMAAEFTTLIEIRVGTVVQETVDGGDQHDYALVLVGLLALPMALGATRGGSRPAMVALLALGAIAALIGFVGDLPDVQESGVIGERYESAEAEPGTGFYLETLGAVIVIVSAVAMLIMSAPVRDRGEQPASAEPRPRES